MIFVLVSVVAIALAYANGANDNFKGVATLYGCGATNYRRALIWATATTLLGSVAAVLLAGSLIKSFGGKGLIDDALVAEPAFASAVALGGGLTVLLATRLGMPVSTTHGLIGALLGTGLVAGSSMNLTTLGTKFVIPLLLSPFLAIFATGIIYPLLRFARQRLGVTSEFCLCVGVKEVEVIPSTALNCQSIALEKSRQLTISSGEKATCESRYRGQVLGVDAETALNRGHFLSAGIVSFARGLNDTPKIAALLLLVPAFGPNVSLFAVGLAIAAGGWIASRRVAETMSQRITALNHGQGLTANVITGAIVIGASRLGLPVSTTHVSCGSLFGIGAVTGGARPKVVATILLSWIITLPMAGGLAAVSYLAIRSIT